MDEPSFFHQWQSDATLEQYTEQQIAVAFGQGEMEAAALYMNAARAGKKALCILTVVYGGLACIGTHQVISRELNQRTGAN